MAESLSSFSSQILNTFLCSRYTGREPLWALLALHKPAMHFRLRGAMERGSLPLRRLFPCEAKTRLLSLTPWGRYPRFGPTPLSPFRQVAFLIAFLGTACVLINYDSDRQRMHFRATDGKALIWGRPPVKVRPPALPLRSALVRLQDLSGLVMRGAGACHDGEATRLATQQRCRCTCLSLSAYILLLRLKPELSEVGFGTSPIPPRPSGCGASGASCPGPQVEAQYTTEKGEVKASLLLASGW